MKEKILASLFYILPHHAISWLMFKGARVRWLPLKNFIIKTYTDLNPIKMHEAVEEDMFAYESLNAFFTRALKTECRPFDEDQSNWLCPVDGLVSQAQAIKHGRVFQAKGHDYSLLELVGGTKNLKRFFTTDSSQPCIYRLETIIESTCRRRAHLSICNTFLGVCLV